jgi:L-lysine 6-transaminase
MEYVTQTEPNDVHEIMREFTIGDGEHIVIDREKSLGSYMVDARNGRRYLDCASQFASQALGWNHPKLVKAMAHLGVTALHKYANSDYYSTDLADFVREFANITPDFKYHFFIEGGALAVENAIKAAFDWKARMLDLDDEEVNDLDVIHFKQSFHGRSGYTLSLTNTVPNKVSLFPKFKWSRVLNPKIHFPEVEHDVLAAEKESLYQILTAITKNAKKTAAIIVESIQGEGGDNHFRPEFFQQLRQIADTHDVMLIMDEVQTGLGMTGHFWCYQHYGIVPDMICFGKKTQVCGFCCTDRIDSVENNVFHMSSRINSTWGGNIVDMVRSKYIMQIILEDGLVANAANVGRYFLNKLHAIPRISNVRGRGLFIAFDLESDASRNDVLRKMREEMTVLPCGERSIRLRPHLTFSQKDVDEAVRIITKAVS